MKKLVFIILALVIGACSSSSPTPPSPPGPVPPNPNPPKPGCIPEPKADAGPDQYIVLGLSMSPYATIGTSPTVNGQSYAWSPVVGISLPSEAITIAEPSKTTKYVLTATNACGSSVSQVTVHVLSEGIELF